MILYYKTIQSETYIQTKINRNTNLQLFMKQELWQDQPWLPRLCEVAALYRENIQELAVWPDCLPDEAVFS